MSLKAAVVVVPPRRETMAETAEKDAEIRDALRAFVASGDDERVFPGEYTRRDRWAVHRACAKMGMKSASRLVREEKEGGKKSIAKRVVAIRPPPGETVPPPPPLPKPLVTHPRDLRDAITALANTHATIGDSDGVRALMDELAQTGETASHTTPFAWRAPFLKDFSRRHSSPALPFQHLGVEPDMYVFNALLRSEAAEKAAAASNMNAKSTADGVGAATDDDDDDDDEREVDVHRHKGWGVTDTKQPLQDAVMRVENAMRTMIEGGVEPDLHSFMALLGAYAKIGDIASQGDALVGMQQRSITLDTWAFNTLLRACAVACDLDSAMKIRSQMRVSGVAADDITFLHLYTACARRARQVAQMLGDAYADEETTASAGVVWDDDGAWDDDFGPGESARGRKRRVKAESHAALTGTLIAPPAIVGVKDVASLAAAAAAEGISSMRGMIARGGGADADELKKACPYEAVRGDLDAAASGGSGGSGRRRAVASVSNPGPRGEPPELARARNALFAFRDDMTEAGVAFTPACASALINTLGSLGEFDAMMQARSISHWSPYDRVRVVNADPRGLSLPVACLSAQGPSLSIPTHRVAFQLRF